MASCFAGMAFVPRPPSPQPRNILKKKFGDVAVALGFRSCALVVAVPSGRSR